MPCETAHTHRRYGETMIQDGQFRRQYTTTQQKVLTYLKNGIKKAIAISSPGILQKTSGCHPRRSG